MSPCLLTLYYIDGITDPEACSQRFSASRLYCKDPNHALMHRRPLMHERIVADQCTNNPGPQRSGNQRCKHPKIRESTMHAAKDQGINDANTQRSRNQRCMPPKITKSTMHPPKDHEINDADLQRSGNQRCGPPKDQCTNNLGARRLVHQQSGGPKISAPTIRRVDHRLVHQRFSYLCSTVLHHANVHFRTLVPTYTAVPLYRTFHEKF